MANTILFAILAAISVLCAVGVVINDNPVRSALSLVGVLFSVAVLFLTLHASFVAAVQVMVYAGAIMVLFLFVIMLLNLGTPEQVVNRLKPQGPLSVLAGVVLVAVVAGVVAAVPQASVPLSTQMSGAYEIGTTIFTGQWLFPFEAVSILLLIATIGAVVLAKRRI